MRPSASLRGLDVAGGDLAFVGGEGGQDLGLLTLRDLEGIQGPSELRCRIFPPDNELHNPGWRLHGFGGLTDFAFVIGHGDTSGCLEKQPLNRQACSLDRREVLVRRW
jgi:hypothetical protein